MKIRIAGALVALLLLAAACGSDREGDDAGAASGAPDGEEEVEAASFGDLDSPCGPGQPSSAPDEGVTAESILIGYGDDAGYALAPGINHEMGDAVKAMIAWCNEQGGINGRQLEGIYYDAKITDVNNAILKACDDGIFMLVGHGFSLDSAQEETRLGCELPAFPGFAVSPAFANGPMAFAALPNPVDLQPVSEARWYAATFPDKAKKVAIVYGNFAATMDTREKQRSTWPKVGIEFLGCDQEYNIAGEADWKPIAQKLKDCGAEAVSFIGGAYPTFVNLLQASQQLDYEPDWLLQANFYDPALAEANASGIADKVYIRTADVPLVFADRNDATQDYLDIVEADGGDASLLGSHAASAFLLWATLADACGDDLTRACVLEGAAEVHEWTGGGLAGPADVAGNEPTTCEAIIGLKGSEWIQIHPEEPGELDCNEDNVQPVTGPVVDRAQLDEDRISRTFG